MNVGLFLGIVIHFLSLPAHAGTGNVFDSSLVRPVTVPPFDAKALSGIRVERLRLAFREGGVFWEFHLRNPSPKPIQLAFRQDREAFKYPETDFPFEVVKETWTFAIAGGSAGFIRIEGRVPRAWSEVGETEASQPDASNIAALQAVCLKDFGTPVARKIAKRVERGCGSKVIAPTELDLAQLPRAGILEVVISKAEGKSWISTCAAGLKKRGEKDFVWVVEPFDPKNLRTKGLVSVADQGKLWDLAEVARAGSVFRWVEIPAACR